MEWSGVGGRVPSLLTTTPPPSTMMMPVAAALLKLLPPSLRARQRPLSLSLSLSLSVVSSFLFLVRSVYAKIVKKAGGRADELAHGREGALGGGKAACFRLLRCRRRRRRRRFLKMKFQSLFSGMQILPHVNLLVLLLVVFSDELSSRDSSSVCLSGFPVVRMDGWICGGASCACGITWRC